MVELAESGAVPIYGINYKDRSDEALAFLEELGDPFTRIGADRSGRVAIDWGVYGLPETFVIDAEGRIAYIIVQPVGGAGQDPGTQEIVERQKPVEDDDD